MTRGRKTGGRNFQKGVQTYFSKLSEEDKELRKMTRGHAKTVIARNALMTLPELETKLHDEIESTPCIELLVMKCLQKAIKESDTIKLDWFFKNWFGNLKENKYEERKVVVRIEDQSGNSLDLKDMSKLDNTTLRQVVDAMVSEDDAGTEL
jgi:hypothetical protein